jgi:tetratricopeptide (TPR) repeat protein
MAMTKPLRHSAALIILLAILMLGASTAKAQRGDDLETLSLRVEQLYQAGRYAEATELAKRQLALAERRFGPNNPNVGRALNNLAALYHGQGRDGEAEPIMKRALAIAEKALGPDDPDVASDLNNLAEMYRAQGRYVDAEPLYKRALVIAEKALGPNHPDVAVDLNNLALLYNDQRRFAEAEPLYKRALDIDEKALGPDDPTVGIRLNNLALLYSGQGRYDAAEPLYKRALAIAEKAFGSNRTVGNRLNNLANLYRDQGRLAEAEPLYKRSLAIREKVFGSDHPDVGETLTNLASLYNDLGRYAEAEPLMKRVLAIDRKTLGPDHPDVGTDLNHLAELYRAQQRYAEAEPLYKQAIAIAEKAHGPNHPDVGERLNNLALLYSAEGRYAEAQPIKRRAQEIGKAEIRSLYEKYLPLVRADKNDEALPYARRLEQLSVEVFGRDDSAHAEFERILATVLTRLGHFEEAEQRYLGALRVQEKVFGHESPELVPTLDALGHLYQDEWRRREQEQAFRRVVQIREKTLKPNDPELAESLNRLAASNFALIRLSEATKLSQRAVEIFENAYGPRHPAVAAAILNWAQELMVSGQLVDSERLYLRAIAIFEGLTDADLKEDRRQIIVNHFGALTGLGQILARQHRYPEAEKSLQDALSVDRKAFGDEDFGAVQVLSILADLYLDMDRLGDAESEARRALDITKRYVSPNHPAFFAEEQTLARVLQKQGRLAEAESIYREIAAAGAEDPNEAVILADLGEVLLRRSQFREAYETLMRATAAIAEQAMREQSINRGRSFSFPLLVRAAWSLRESQPHSTEDTSGVAFAAAQGAELTSASIAITQMAARFGNQRGELAELVRTRQDLAYALSAEQQREVGLLGATPDLRKEETIGASRDARRAIERRINEIDAKLKAEFPNYTALIQPSPLSIEDVQARLRPDEVLVLFLDLAEAPEETFIWAVSKTNTRWVRSEFGTQKLAREVARLRCGLDYQGAWRAAESRCADLLKTSYSPLDAQQGKPLPFDLAVAHELYRALFGQIEDLIKDKHLLVVPSGPLTQLPFQVLVTEQPKAVLPSTFVDYRDVAWLARQHAITVLPAVSSLKALRDFAKESHASEAFIGFGDPLLDGDPTRFKDDVVAARLAREARCPKISPERVEWLANRGDSAHFEVRSNGDFADVADIRMWAPLPETADELCDVAENLGVDPATHLYLGAKATETEIKRLSDNGTLVKYKIVHFATHGAVAGELSGTSEPGLILTPPEKASEIDDGYLTASEIAALKLDADWVILSACNTAAGGTQGAEALSGLARAFFYAGARSLLVSHWEVDSEATVKLITKAVDELKRDPKIGRAEALRRSMLSMIGNGPDYEAHPAFWAPFVLVGEGGVAR